MSLCHYAYLTLPPCGFRVSGQILKGPLKIKTSTTRWKGWAKQLVAGVEPQATGSIPLETWCLQPSTPSSLPPTLVSQACSHTEDCSMFSNKSLILLPLNPLFRTLRTCTTPPSLVTVPDSLDWTTGWVDRWIHAQIVRETDFRRPGLSWKETGVWF